MKARSIIFFALLALLIFPSFINSANANPLSNASSQVDDNRWIAYVDKENSVSVIHQNGSGNTKISQDLAVLPGIRWSSSGRYLTFVSGSTPFSFITNPYSLWVWDSQTYQVVLIQETEVYVAYAWAPTDDILAYTSVVSEPNPLSFPSWTTYSLNLINLTTGEKQTIIEEMKGSFNWLPEGDRIAYEPFWEAKPSPCTFCFDGWDNYSGIKTIDIQTGESSALIEPRDNPLTGIQISPKGSFVSFDEVGTSYAAYDGPGCAWLSFVSPVSNSGAWQTLPNSYCEWSPHENMLACNSGGCGISGEPVSIYDSNFQLIKEIPQVSSHLSDAPPGGTLLWALDESKLAIGIGYWITPPIRKATLIVDTEGWNILADLQGVAFDWSPDGNFLLFNNQLESDEGFLGIYDIDSKEFQYIGVSSVQDAVWQSRKPSTISLEDWQNWKTRKAKSAQELQQVAVELAFDQKILGLLPAPNETAVNTLLTQLTNDPVDVSSQQVEAFYRMLLEEETLAKIQDSYEISSNDLGNWLSNLMKFFTFSAQIFAKHEMALTWTRSFAEDIGNLIIYSIEDSQDRQNIQTLYEAALVIGFNQGSFAGYVKDVSPEMYLKYLVARVNHQRFTDLVQPTIDRGLNSYHVVTPYWDVTGTRPDAEGTTGYLARTAGDFASTYHENYEQSQQARDWASFFNDGAEFFRLAHVPFADAINWFTRGQILILDGLSIWNNILPPLNCSLTLAQATGSQSFQPQNELLPDCELTATSSTKPDKLMDSSTNEVDEESWVDFQTEYFVALDSYADQARSIENQINDGKTISKQDRKNLEVTLSSVRSLMVEGSTLLSPRDGQSWIETTRSAFEGIIKIKVQTAMLLYILDLPKDSLNDDQVKTAVSQTFSELQRDIAQNRADLEEVISTGPSMGIPLVETVDDPIHADQGKMLEIQVRLKNVGSSPLPAGEVTAYLTSSGHRNAISVPTLEAGHEQILSLQVESVSELPSQVVVTYKAGDQIMTRRVLVVENSSATKNSLNNQPLLIVGGLIIILGGAMVLIAGFLLRSKKNAKNPNNHPKIN